MQGAIDMLIIGFLIGMGIAGVIVVMMIVGAIKKQRDKKKER